MRSQKRGLAVIITAVLLAVLLSANAAAANTALSADGRITVNALSQPGNNWYKPYALGDGLMPFEKSSGFDDCSYGRIGFADIDGNVVIPIHDNWSSTQGFDNGTAIICDWNGDDIAYFLINTSGQKIFDFNGAPTTLENDPNGIEYICVYSNSDRDFLCKGVLTVEFYNQEGVFKTIELPDYNRIGEFSNGIANLYKFSERTNAGGVGAVGDDTEMRPCYRYFYTVEGSINTKGEVFNYPANVVYPKYNGEETYGFTVEEDNSVEYSEDFSPYTTQHIIKNSFGDEIYRYDSVFDTHKYINEDAILVETTEPDGHKALTLMDANGRLYNEYKFSGFQGSFGNRFFARRFLTLTEESVYDPHRALFANSGMDILYPFIDELQPVTLYEVNVDNTIPATLTTADITVDGSPVSVFAYNIKNNNYFKLRDIAKVLGGSEKQFEVTWDGGKNAINLISGKPYTPVGGELVAVTSTAVQSATATTATVRINDEVVSLMAYTINGNNYFKLRDIGQAFNFGVLWDGSTNTISIDTSKGYEN